MKATKIYYQKCFNLGNYQNEVIGIELQIEDGEKAIDVLNKAKQFIESGDIIKYHIEEYNRSLNIINNIDNYTGRQIRAANEFINKYNNKEELPF